MPNASSPVGHSVRGCIPDPRLPAPEVIRFETSPDKQAQADRIEVRPGKTKLAAFAGTPGVSRFGFVRLAENDRLRP